MRIKSKSLEASTWALYRQIGGFAEFEPNGRDLADK